MNQRETIDIKTKTFICQYCNVAIKYYDCKRHRTSILHINNVLRSMGINDASCLCHFDDIDSEDSN